MTLNKDDGGPSIGDVHVNGPDWKPRPKSKAKAPANLGGTPGLATEGALEGSRAAVIGKQIEPSPLYVYRPVTNAAEIIRWAKAQGLAQAITPDDMHVTVAYSRSPVDWQAAGEAWCTDPDGGITVKPGGPRQLALFGPEQKCLVLAFASNDLNWRHASLEEIGASWDWESYQPHLTLTYSAPEGLDLSSMEPYQGAIELGAEVFEPLVSGWGDSIVEKSGSFEVFCKVAGASESLGLVFGWGIVCKLNGEDYVDTQRNSVPEPAMVEATTDFMKSARVHGDMHVRGTEASAPAGVVVHSMPITTDMWKGMWTMPDGSWPAAMPEQPPRTGWWVATAPDPAMLAKFLSGEYTGFSIGGDYIEIDGQPVRMAA